MKGRSVERFWRSLEVAGKWSQLREEGFGVGLGKVSFPLLSSCCVVFMVAIIISVILRN